MTAAAMPIKPACGGAGIRVPSACILYIDIVLLNDLLSALTPLSTLVLPTKQDP